MKGMPNTLTSRESLLDQIEYPWASKRHWEVHLEGVGRQNKHVYNLSRKRTPTSHERICETRNHRRRVTTYDGSTYGTQSHFGSRCLISSPPGSLWASFVPLERNRYVTHVGCGGCYHCQRPQTSFRQPGLASEERSRAHHCLVYPVLCAKRYFTPLPKTAWQVREPRTDTIYFASDLFGALAVCGEHRANVLNSSTSSNGAP